MQEVDRNDLELLRTAALEGGRIALSYFKNNPDNWLKEGDSPVSEADMAVDAYLKKTLMAARPDYGWLSEESEDDPQRLTKKRCFIVDPIDGTRAYLEGRTEWCLSLAVVEDGLPVAAIIFAPVREEMFAAVKGGGASLNAGSVKVSTKESLDGATLIGPDAFFSKPLAKEAGLVKKSYLRSLAYRFAIVAAGRLDASVARARARDWDLAAADLLLSEAGGRLVDTNGRRLTYNKINTKHPAVVASSAILFNNLRHIVEA